MIAALALIAVLVQPGNTLSGIAASHSVSLAAVEQANPQITDPNLIYVGQSVNVPSAGSPDSGGSSEPSAEAPSPVAAPVANSQANTGIPAWATCIVQRESGGDAGAINSIPGYVGNGGGLFGDLASTWGGYDGYAEPFQAPVAIQVQFNDQLSGNGANLLPWAADGCPGT